LAKDPTSLVKAEYENICHLTDRDAKHLYLQLCRMVSSYSCEYYRVRLMSAVAQKKPWCLLGVGPNHLLIMDDKTKEIMGTFAFVPRLQWKLESIVERAYFSLSSKIAQQLSIAVTEIPETLVFTAEDGVLESITQTMAFHRHQQQVNVPVTPPRTRKYTFQAPPQEKKGSPPFSAAGSRSMPKNAHLPLARESTTLPKDFHLDFSAEFHAKIRAASSSSSLEQPEVPEKFKKLSLTNSPQESSTDTKMAIKSSPSSPQGSPTQSRRHASVSILEIKKRFSTNALARSVSSKIETAKPEPIQEEVCYCSEVPVRSIIFAILSC
jgi:hypothetical protein